MKSRGKSLQKYSCFSFATFAAWREKDSRKMFLARKSYRFLLAEPQSLLSHGVIVSENERTQRALRSWEEFTEMNHHYSCGISSQPQYLLNLKISSYAPHRPKVSLLSPHKAEGLSAISASHTYHLRGSISSAALREKSDIQGQHWVCVTLYHLNMPANEASVDTGLLL